MQASTQRLLCTFLIAIAGATVSLVGVVHPPLPQLHAPVACGLLAQANLAPR